MPVCPGCHAEYRADVKRCADCNLELVDFLPDTGRVSAQETELVELATFATVSEAEMMQELLESNDIETVLRGLTDPIGAASGAEPVTLLVEKLKLPDAKDLYDAFFAGEVEGEENLEQPNEQD